MIVWKNAPSTAIDRIDTCVSRFDAYLLRVRRDDHQLPSLMSIDLYLDRCLAVTKALQVALLKKRAALATKMAELIDRRGKKSLALTSSRKSRLQTALISLQNGLVRSQYQLAARVQASLGPQSV